ncbi:hypothetical protein FQZ97_1023850 [compost metagenome]
MPDVGQYLAVRSDGFSRLVHTAAQKRQPVKKLHPGVIRLPSFNTHAQVIVGVTLFINIKQLTAGVLYAGVFHFFIGERSVQHVKSQVPVIIEPVLIRKTKIKIF